MAFFPYNVDLVSEISKLPDRNYLGRKAKNRVAWSVPVEQEDQLSAAVRRYFPIEGEASATSGDESQREGL
jgi:hypothetical protein